MDATNNPYQTPVGQLATDDAAFGEIRFFSPDTRIGRLRYLAHGFLLMIGWYILLGIGAALAMGASNIFWLLVALATVGMIVTMVILMIQRLHDLNQSGWMCLLTFVPLLGFFFYLYMLFAPGAKGANNYGLQPPPNKTWHWILGLMTPVVFVVGIVAAISLPAYQDYMERASSSSEYSTEYSDDDDAYDDSEDDE